MINARIPLAIAAVSLLAACSIKDEPEADEDAALAGASSEARQAYRAYLAVEGENLEGCFKDLPQMDTDVAGEQTATGDTGVVGTPAQATRVVMALDASGSMAGRTGGETKMAAAKDAARDFLGALPDGVDVGLIAFGHEGDNSEAGKTLSCRGIDTIYPVGAADSGKISRALGTFDATGWTPLAKAIERAGASFTDSEKRGAQVVYVVSDGEETCGGDPVAAARKLHEGGTRAIVNIIGFDLAPSDRAALKSVAQAGGGEFIEVSSGSDLRRVASLAGTQLRNSGAQARTSLRTAGGQARNTLATGGQLARTSLCLGGATARETLGLGRWVKQQDLARDVESELNAMLKRRAAIYDRRFKKYRTVAERRMEKANAVLQADKDRFDKDYDKLDPAMKRGGN